MKKDIRRAAYFLVYLNETKKKGKLTFIEVEEVYEHVDRISVMRKSLYKKHRYIRRECILGVADAISYPITLEKQERADITRKIIAFIEVITCIRKHVNYDQYIEIAKIMDIISEDYTEDIL